MCCVVSACWGLKKSSHLRIPFQGMSTNTSHRRAAARKRAFKCPQTSGMMGKEGSSRKGEVLKPEGLLTSLGRWCGTATAAGDFGSPGQQSRLEWCALKFCVGLQSELEVVLHLFMCHLPSWAGVQVETSFSCSVLGNMPKSTGKGKGDDKEKGKRSCCHEESRINSWRTQEAIFSGL